VKTLLGSQKLYNPSATPIPSGTILHLVSATVHAGELYPVFEYAKADNFETCQGSLVFAGEEIAGTSLGSFDFHYPKLTADTSGVTAGAQLWLSDTVAGAFTNVKPLRFGVSIGGAYNSAVDGAIWANITNSTYDSTNDNFIGSIKETFDFLVTSNGSIVTGTLTNADNILDNLTLVLPDFVTFDTTTAPSTITLTAGTDSNTQTNYVYIPEDTKALTVSTTGFPTDQNHCKIATLEVQSAATVQSDGGARGNQNWNDHFKKVDGNGHANHVAAWIREQFAKAKKSEGCSVTLDSTAGNGYLTVASGLISQLHKQSISSMAMPTLNCLIHNDPDTTYRSTNNLNTITKYSDGSNWSNEWGKIVIWISANKGGEPNYIYVNLPRDGYNTELKAFEDEKSRANYEIDDKLISKAALVGEFVIKISSGSITYNGTSTGFKDLRGTVPSNTSSGGAGGVTSLLALDDVSPSSFSGQAGKSLTVASGETTTEFVEHLKTDGTSTMQGNINLNGNNLLQVGLINTLGNANITGTLTTEEDAILKSIDYGTGSTNYVRRLLWRDLNDTTAAFLGFDLTSDNNFYISNQISGGNVTVKDALKLDSTLDVYGAVDLHNQDVVNGGNGSFESVKLTEATNTSSFIETGAAGENSFISIYRWTGTGINTFGSMFYQATDKLRIQTASAAEYGSHTWVENLTLGNDGSVSFENVITINNSVTSSGVANNSFFRDSARSNKLSYKGIAGAITTIEP
ncbi:MAG: hypothetical protein GY928_13535, partial [Colwellia sp.]|nr:hypothetical protein [Colwellia sp.]